MRVVLARVWGTILLLSKGLVCGLLTTTVQGVVCNKMCWYFDVLVKGLLSSCRLSECFFLIV